MKLKVTFPVFNLTLDEIDGLELESNGTGNRELDLSPQLAQVDLNTSIDGSGVGLSCLLCGNLEFENVDAQRAHFKLDWHRANVKRKLKKGVDCITEQEFEDKIDDLSSISGSGSDNEISDSENSNTKTRNRSSVTVFRAPHGLTYSVYTSILTRMVREEGTSEELLNGLRALALPRKTPTPDVSQRSEVGLRVNLGASEKVDILHKPTNQTWGVLLCSGGHFAGCIFDGLELRVSKTYHRYVVRRKQGGMQSVRDSASGTSAPKSAGANLRRQQEAALQADIRTLLLDTWKDHLHECSLVFVWAPRANEKFIYGSGGKVSANCLKKTDPRVRGIPFPVRRPTLAEATRVHRNLCTVHQSTVRTINVSSDVSEGMTTGLPSPRGDHPSLTAKDLRQLERQTMNLSINGEGKCPGISETGDAGSTTTATSMIVHDGYSIVSLGSDSVGSPMPCVPPSFADSGTGAVVDVRGELSDIHRRLFNACEKGDIAETEKIMAQEREELEACLDAIDLDFNTCLHVASTNSRDEVVWELLQKGANPCTQNARGLTPYMLAKDKGTRDMFRRYMGLEMEKWDWVKAGVPSALTADMEAAQAEREKMKKEKQKERKKKLTQQKKLRDKEKAVRQETEDKARLDREAKQAIIDAEARRIANMSDREKRAMAAEARMKKAPVQSQRGVPSGEKCSNNSCEGPLMRGQEFSRLNYKYCSVQCVNAHRENIEST
eukprot:CFRG0285T1